MKWLLCVGMIALCGGVGFQAGNVLTNRRKGISSLVFALDILRGEIAYSMTPLRRAFQKIARVTPGQVGMFFASCAQEMEGNCRRMEDIWKQELKTLEKQLPLGGEEMDSLLHLGAVLGRNDQENQQKALDAARAQLQQLLDEARQKEREEIRLYRSLGVMAGIFLVILLW